MHAIVTWDARDPANIDWFVANHIPPGARVLGEGPDYFFAVEGSGSRYYQIPQVSWADWARWVRPQRPLADIPLPDADYLLWPATGGPLPKNVSCAISGFVASYGPPPPNLPSLNWVAAGDPYASYPVINLYRLGPPCGV